MPRPTTPEERAARLQKRYDRREGRGQATPRKPVPAAASPGREPAFKPGNRGVAPHRQRRRRAAIMGDGRSVVADVRQPVQLPPAQFQPSLSATDNAGLPVREQLPPAQYAPDDLAAKQELQIDPATGAVVRVPQQLPPAQFQPGLDDGLQPPPILPPAVGPPDGSVRVPQILPPAQIQPGVDANAVAAQQLSGYRGFGGIQERVPQGIAMAPPQAQTLGARPALGNPMAEALRRARLGY